MKKVKHYVLFAAFVAVLAVASAVQSENLPSIDGTAQADPVFQDQGLAIRGYDPVAYFDQGKPVKGNETFEYRYEGALWRFVDAKNKEAFQKDPHKYLPQYGGYCAYGMSRGYAVPIDPQAWSIVDGKLYLNYSLDVQEKWNKGIPGFITKANENWPKIPKKSAK